jgi:AbrB family looped-hinge helix DNA binding protein
MECVEGLSKKSAKIRALAEAGHTRGDIARFLGVRYQHVRNVLVHGAVKVADAPADKEEMDKIAAGLKSKADKIRALAKAGHSRTAIAQYLKIRYQHVRNVLVRDKAEPRGDATAGYGEQRAIWSKVGPAGRIVIPAEYRESLGLKEGDSVHLQLVDGEIRIVPQDVVFRQIQETVAKYVPEGVSLADELIEERRREAKREERGA